MFVARKAQKRLFAHFKFLLLLLKTFFSFLCLHFCCRNFVTEQAFEKLFFFSREKLAQTSFVFLTSKFPFLKPLTYFLFWQTRFVFSVSFFLLFFCRRTPFCQNRSKNAYRKNVFKVGVVKSVFKKGVWNFCPKTIVFFFASPRVAGILDP